MSDRDYLDDAKHMAGHCGDLSAVMITSALIDIASSLRTITEALLDDGYPPDDTQGKGGQ